MERPTKERLYLLRRRDILTRNDSEELFAEIDALRDAARDAEDRHLRSLGAAHGMLAALREDNAELNNSLALILGKKGHLK